MTELPIRLHGSPRRRSRGILEPRFSIFLINICIRYARRLIATLLCPSPDQTLDLRSPAREASPANHHESLGASCIVACQVSFASLNLPAPADGAIDRKMDACILPWRAHAQRHLSMVLIMLAPLPLIDKRSSNP